MAKKQQFHITEGKFNRTLCRKDTLTIAEPVITLSAYLKRRPIEAELVPMAVCKRCARVASRFMVKRPIATARLS